MSWHVPHLGQAHAVLLAAARLAGAAKSAI